MTKRLNFCFFGSSDFSVPVLRNILKKYKPEVVFTLPAKPKGRGQKLEPNIVYSFALKNKLPVLEIENFENFNFKFKFGVIAGFSKIIPKEIFQNFEKGILNIHPSLLPKYRGPNPIRETILNGDKETGVTIILIDELIDHGPIIAQKKIFLTQKETYKELEERLGILGGQLFNEIIEKYLEGKINPIFQDDSLATYTKKLSKEDGLLRLEENYEIWNRKIRALNPWPGTYIFIKLKNEIKILKIFSIRKLKEGDIKRDLANKLKIGDFFAWKNSLCLKICDGYVLIEELQLQDRKKMNSREFLNGYPIGSFSFYEFNSNTK